MLQVGIEPTTFALRSMCIHSLYKSNALPAELLEQKTIPTNNIASFGNRTQDLPLTRRMHYHYAKEAEYSWWGLNPRSSAFESVVRSKTLNLRRRTRYPLRYRSIQYFEKQSTREIQRLAAIVFKSKLPKSQLAPTFKFIT
jgi:hypothetical protein